MTDGPVTLAGLLAAKRWARVAMGVCAALLLALTVNLHPWWPAAWVAPLPLLLAVIASPTRRESWLLGFVVTLPPHLTYVPYYGAVGMGAEGYVVILLQATLWTGMAHLAAGLMAGGRTKAAVSWLVVFVYPLAFAALDIIITTLSPHSSAGSIGYSQGNNLVVLQLTSVVGVPGVVFVISLLSSALALLVWRGVRGIDNPKLAALVPLVLVLAVLGFGEARIRTSSDAPVKSRSVCWRWMTSLAAVLNRNFPACSGSGTWTPPANLPPMERR